jgi:uncharacterized protein YcfL
MNKITLLCISLLVLSGCSSSTPNAQPTYERATIEVINGAE